MKKILFIAFAFISLSLSAQIDSSNLQLPIKLTIKVKYWAIAGSYITNKSAFSDTVLKCIGSGTQLDSLYTGTVRAGRFYQFFQRWVSDPVGANYTLLYEILNSTAANGGIYPQLNQFIANGTANEKKIAQWLKSQIQDLMTRHAAASDTQILKGIINLQTLQSNPSDQ